MRAYTINANDQIRNASDYKSLIVAYKNGSPVRLSDVGDVVDGAQNDKLGAWMNETPAIILNIQRQPGANVIAVVEGIKALLPQLQASLPAAIDLNILTDRTVTIRASVQDVEFELTLAVILVVLVIFVFLRNARATLIPSLSVPLSLVGTLGAMYLFGFSLNNLSLMALTIATGFVVDDAIVVIENISRYIEEGESPLQAALHGSEQIGFTIISLTVSLIAVLIPLLFMGDVVGRLFREFAITLSVTILISAVVSLTLVPMACAKLLKPETETHENAFQRYSREGFDRIIEVYGHALNWVLDRQTFVLLIALGTFALTAVLYIVIPKGFFPLQDTGVIQAISEAPQSVSYAAMAERQQQLASVILKDPDVESLSSFIGVDGTNTTLNSGRILINLKPHDQRKSDIAHGDAAHQGQHRVADRHHALYAAGSGSDDRRHRQPDAIPVHPAGCRSGAAGRMDAQARRQAEQLPQLADVASDISAQGLSVFVEIDRDQAARFGITPATIDNALYDSYGQRIVSTIFTNSNQYRVILEADPSLQTSLQSLSRYLSALLGGQHAGAAGRDGQDAAGNRAAAGLASRAVSRPPPSPSTWRRAPRSAGR